MQTIKYSLHILCIINEFCFNIFFLRTKLIYKINFKIKNILIYM